MLYRYSEVFRTTLAFIDVALVAMAWVGAYWLRFDSGLFAAPLGIPPFEVYLYPLLVILPLWLVLFRSYGLYEPQRTASTLHEASAVVRANAIGVLLLAAATFFVRNFSYSRGVVLTFSVLAPSLTLGVRTVVRSGLRGLRRRGYNLRYVVVVGGGQLAEEVIDRVHAHPEAGLRVLGVLAEGLGRVGDRVRGVPVLAGYEGLKAILHGDTRVDQVIVALPRYESGIVEKVLADLEDEIVSVKLAPDLLHVMTLCSSVEDLDGLPIIALRDTPMVGWAAVEKRVFDLLGSALVLVLIAPLLGMVALAILLSSGRPVFYSQLRMGLDGRVFRMWKFRSMRPGSEDRSGPVWAVSDDPRRTRLGAWLRRLNLDELPQLWNVLRGDMSLVGPRPERPVFIEEFRSKIPGYMLRHKVRAGLTGWAQVHGWRGNTSLHKRVEHDLYYIQNWSPMLDFRILLMTAVRAITHRDGG